MTSNVCACVCGLCGTGRVRACVWSHCVCVRVDRRETQHTTYGVHTHPAHICWMVATFIRCHTILHGLMMVQKRKPQNTHINHHHMVPHMYTLHACSDGVCVDV